LATFRASAAPILPPTVCKFRAVVIRLPHKGFTTMMRSRGAGSGFIDNPAPVASSRLTHAVAASLAVALSVCLAATFAMLSINPLALLPA
jgi:hypothetical protein